MVFGVETKDERPATGAAEAGGAVPEEDADIEEIVRPEEEMVNPQRIHVARKRGCEWVVYEEDHSGKAT